MIVQHLLDTLILMTWMVVISLAFMGWGELVRHGLRFEVADQRVNSTWLQNICNIWSGLCICIALTELLHFFFAITWVISLGVLGTGVAYSLFRGKLRNLSQLMHEPLSKLFSITQGLWALGGLAACFIWISVAMGGPTNYDSGLYHFGSIKWLNEHSLTYGLVNLHTRLAYNQSYFALIALLNFSPMYDRAYAGTGLFLFILTAATCLQLLQRPLLKPSFLAFALLVLTGGFVLKASSPTPDLAVGLFQVVIFFILLKVLLIPSGKFLLPLLLILCVTALTLKLSMVVFCAAAVCIAHYHFWNLVKSNHLPVVRLLILCALILGIHVLRGYALSGLPFYPSTFAGLWALPYTPSPASVLKEANTIYSWARLPGVPPELVLSNWNWIKPWSGSLPTRFLILVGLAAVFLISNLVLFRLIPRVQWRALWLYVPLLLSAGFWFFTAPDVRFLGLIPELTVALGAWLLYSIVVNHLCRKLKMISVNSKLLLLIGVISLSFVTVLFILKSYTGVSLARYFYLSEILYGLSQIGINFTFVLAALSGLLMVNYSNPSSFAQRLVSPRTAIPIPAFPAVVQLALLVLFLCTTINYIAQLALFKNAALTGWAPVPTEPYDQEKLLSGLQINVPKSDDLCWNTPLPCLPRQQFNERLGTFNLLGLSLKLNGFHLNK